MRNEWPAVGIFLFGTAGAVYLIRHGLSRRGKDGARDTNGRAVASWRAIVAVAILLWLFLLAAELYLFSVVYRPQP